MLGAQEWRCDDETCDETVAHPQHHLLGIGSGSDVECEEFVRLFDMNDKPVVTWNSHKTIAGFTRSLSNERS